MLEPLRRSALAGKLWMFVAISLHCHPQAGWLRLQILPLPPLILSCCAAPTHGPSSGTSTWCCARTPCHWSESPLSFSNLPWHPRGPSCSQTAPFPFHRASPCQLPPHRSWHHPAAQRQQQPPSLPCAAPPSSPGTHRASAARYQRSDLTARSKTHKVTAHLPAGILLQWMHHASAALQLSFARPPPQTSQAKHRTGRHPSDPMR
mmetsp:Transcript_8678/g.19344  ORF Transcript_8678/g.19344 Transcript_8678/m.19344 type:complete len:205 (-) Transcript_8678:827-1441(-)